MAHPRTLLVSCLLGSALVVAPGCGNAHGIEGTDGGTSTGDSGHAEVDAWTGGSDGGPVADTGAPNDAGPAPSCDAQDAQQVPCSAICDGPDSFAWDGERCVQIDCGACTGSACGALPHSMAECQALHATCIPELCRSSGGEWRFYDSECRHYHCGQPQPAECLVGMPICNCGDGRSFDPARGGCFLDATCPDVDPLPPMELCEATGGTWATGICCNTVCGQHCDLDCVAPGCECGPLEVFDAIRGCVDAAQCHEITTPGAECNDQLRCAGEMICCQHCTGAGCETTRHCQAPVCDSDPNIDVCGNNLLAP